MSREPSPSAATIGSWVLKNARSPSDDAPTRVVLSASPVALGPSETRNVERACASPASAATMTATSSASRPDAFPHNPTDPCSPPGAPKSSARLRPLQLRDLDLGQHPLGPAGVEHSGAHVHRRLGAAGDREPQRLTGRCAVRTGGEEAGQERIPGADGRHRLEAIGSHLVQLALAVPAEQRDAALLVGDDRLARAQVADVEQRGQPVLLVAKL